MSFKNTLATWLIDSKIMDEYLVELQDNAFERGKLRGYAERQDIIERRLQEHSLADFKDKKLVLGYQQAVEVVTGRIK